jgi:hypothetical protein
MEWLLTASLVLLPLLLGKGKPEVEALKPDLVYMGA